MAILALIAAELAAAFTAIGVTGTILGFSAATLAANLVIVGAIVGASLLFARKEERLEAGPTPQAQATLNQAVGSRIRAYGRVKLGGTRAFWDSNGGADLVQLVMCHSGEVDAFEEWWIGDTQVTINGTTFQVIEAPFAGYVVIKPFFGTDTQAAASIIIDRFPTGWATTHQLKGIAYFVSVFTSPPSEEYQKIFPEGYNTPIRAVVRASKCYDPRFGITWWSDNAGVVICDYLMHPDGYNLDISDIDLPSFQQFAYMCDEDISLMAGGTEKRYRIWGVYQLNEDPISVLSRMKKACDAELYETATGKIGIRGGTWVDPTVTFTSANITGHALEQGNNRFSAFNELKILHTSPLHDYQTTETGQWIDLEAQDDAGVLLSDLSIDMCPSSTQALRLAKIHIAKSNPRWKGNVSLDTSGLAAIGERVVYLQIPELAIDEPFLVVSVSISQDLSKVELGVVALDASAYDWDYLTEELDPPLVPVDTRPLLVVPVPVDLTLRTDAAGTTLSAQVDTPTRLDLRLQAEIRYVGGLWTPMVVATGSYIATYSPVITATTYEVRARFLTAQNVSGEWTAVGSIPVVGSPATPTIPTAFTATKVSGNADLDWTTPATSGFYFSQVYRNTVNTFGSATLIGEVYGSGGAAATYLDLAVSAGQKYYWIRAVNIAGATGPETASQTLTFP